MATPLIRKDAWKLSAISTWEPTLLWYAKAVGEMSSRPAADPTSWRFQAGMHGYDPSTDPFVNFGAIPPKALQDKFWKNCQHGSWFFLPWHRMYLGFFEEIVRAAVVKLGGPADWTLPYWNYSDSSNSIAKTLPPCFREPTLPDGSPNPLFVIQGINILRAPGINSGDPSVIPDSDVDLSGCLVESFFSPDTDTTSGDLGFGGPATGFNHDAQVFGANSVESAPHNAVHVDVGGEWVQSGVTLDGWMINPDTAALDPIFWLHHANIDRLWSVWNRISASNTDPAGSVNVGGQNISWQTSVPFPFHDATGNEVAMIPSQVLDTTTTSFSYDYEDTSNPLPLSLMESFALTRSISMKPRLAEMVGASDKPVTLTGSPETTAFVLQPPSGPALVSGAVPAPPPKTYLKIENVVSEKSHATYEVYVNLPDNAEAAAYKEHYAGAMPLFGVIQASTRSDRHAGNGLGFSLDITQLVNRLKARNAWDDQNIRVTFVPRSTGGTARAAMAEHHPIRVGRVSLYRA
jgi:tyrosinase